jgi:F-type H+-transporting ATPase subunit b
LRAGTVRRAFRPDAGRFSKRLLRIVVMATNTDHGLVEGTETHAGTEHSGTGHGGPFPPFDPANFSPLLIWLALTFGLFYLLMSKVALPQVAGILHARRGKINKDIKDANTLRAEAEAAAAALEKTLADARAKALTLAQETQAKLGAEAEAKRHALEANLTAQLSESEAKISAMKSTAMANVDTIAKDAAAAIVSHLTGKPADEKAVAAAITSTKA